MRNRLALILLPMWFLSGAFFPAEGAPVVLEWLMRVNPLTYGVAALRHSLYLGNPGAAGPIPSLGLSLSVIVAFAAVSFAAAAWTASRKEIS